MNQEQKNSRTVDEMLLFIAPLAFPLAAPRSDYKEEPIGPCRRKTKIINVHLKLLAAPTITVVQTVERVPSFEIYDGVGGFP